MSLTAAFSTDVRSTTKSFLLSSRRFPDPGKICKNPNCACRFFRRDKEQKSDYDRRETCSKDCARVVQTLTKAENNSYTDYDYRQIDPSQLSCANCFWMKEDSEIGEHCSKCTTGQMFKKKDKIN